MGVLGSTAAEALEPLREDLPLLFDKAPLPTQHEVWTGACTESFRPGERLARFTTERPDSPAMNATAALVELAEPWPRLEFLGMRELGEPMDLLAADAEALDELCRQLARYGRPVFLSRIPAHSPTPAAAKRAFRWPGRVFVRPATGYPTIALDPSWREPERHLNAGRRSDMRRARRRAEQRGPMTFEMHAPSPAKLGPLFDAVLAIEAAGWKGRERTAMAIDPVRGPFFRRYAERASALGVLRLALL